jgi:N-formylglutamate amidohydrolase
MVDHIGIHGNFSAMFTPARIKQDWMVPDLTTSSLLSMMLALITTTLRRCHSNRCVSKFNNKYIRINNMSGPCKRIRLNKPDLRNRLADPSKERWYNNIVLNIPHASVGGLGIARWDNKVALLNEVRRWTDWYTDLLFIPDKREGIQTLVSDYSRFVVDVERLVNDPLGKKGQGIVYKEFNGLHRTFEGSEEIEMFRYHAKYIRELRLMLDEHSLLIDCHSFPSDYKEAMNANGEMVDVCIGFNNDSTYPGEEVIRTIKREFELHGYKVGINSPFSNAFAPVPNFPSVMIELRKGIYMDEGTLKLLSGAYKVNQVLNEIYRILTA